MSVDPNFWAALGAFAGLIIAGATIAPLLVQAGGRAVARRRLLQALELLRDLPDSGRDVVPLRLALQEVVATCCAELAAAEVRWVASRRTVTLPIIVGITLPPISFGLALLPIADKLPLAAIVLFWAFCTISAVLALVVVWERYVQAPLQARRRLSELRVQAQTEETTTTVALAADVNPAQPPGG